MSKLNEVPAHTLWVELTTRITTQPLHYRSGDENRAAKSVYELFATTRELMKSHPEAKDFNTLALDMLNRTIRPYTARWHGWLTNHKPVPGMPGVTMPVFNDGQVLRTFRTELTQLQEQLRYYVAAFKALADGRPIPEQTDKPDGIIKRNVPVADLGGPITAGLSSQNTELARQYAEINRLEHREILARRNAQSSTDKLLNATGLALSGGGIRSATFCLGIVQTLANRKLFYSFDYLSTVSGGGYLGTFLSSALADEAQSEQNLSAEERIQTIGDVLEIKKDGQETKAVRHLRNYSKYLGTGGVHWMAGLMIFGIFINALLLLPAPLMLAWFVTVLKSGFSFWTSTANTAPLLFGLDPSPSGYCLQWALLMLLISVFILPFVQSVTLGHHSGTKADKRQAWENLTLSLAVASLVFAGLYLLPKLSKVLELTTASSWSQFWPALTVGVFPLIAAYGAQLLKIWKRAHKVIEGLFVLAGPIFFALVFLAAALHLGFFGSKPSITPGVFFLFTVLLWVWGWFLVNINTISPHRYYRNRLCECYLLKRKGNKVTSLSDLPLAELGRGHVAPYHLLNTTVNLTTSNNRELRGRNGDFFVISKHVCGSSVTGYHATQEVVAKNPHLDLGSAMAISGAAASTGMGWQTMAHFRFLMGLMNIRLGYWILNPKAQVRCKYLEGPGPGYILKEVFGKMNEHDRYLNLSDGGHIENLAVYELLRRRCKFIVSVDGGQEPGMECVDLIRLQRYAEIDLGIRMEYDIADLQHNSFGFCRAYAILVKIRYPAVPDSNKTDTAAVRDNDLGWMLYLKLALTGAEPPYVTDYRRLNPTFPHQTTADQFFDEAQFEAYRMLGECAADSLFRNEILETNQPKNLQEWFQALANKLLPDNDMAFKKTPE